MGTVLERTDVARLSEDEKEAIANRILDDVKAERGWDGRFPAPRVRLAQIARHAREHVFRGAALPRDPSERRS